MQFITCIINIIKLNNSKLKEKNALGYIEDNKDEINIIMKIAEAFGLYALVYSPVPKKRFKYANMNPIKFFVFIKKSIYFCFYSIF